LCGIPNVVGALDGTHLKIMAPTESEESYVNRKSYRSINMGTIADIDLKFIWVSANFPGRAQIRGSVIKQVFASSSIWSQSSMLSLKVLRSSALYRDFYSGRKKGTLLVDSAYRSENFLHKPILGESRTEPGMAQSREIY
uniref:DDE Tnp4 domain-containing protein n=1 Tax=Heligmosomoides polygyrus TaxID=6339 RepID=A0A183FC03_HELPZ